MTYNFRYDPEKNLKLLLERGIDFDDMIEAIETGGLLGFIDNPVHSREHQKLFIVRYQGYTFSIPAIHERDNRYFLKTIIPNRKYHKLYP